MIVDVALYQKGLRVDGPTDISDLVDKARREGIRRMLQFVRNNHLPKVTKIEIPTREERNER